MYMHVYDPPMLSDYKCIIILTCSVRDHPEVWLCALRSMDLGFLTPSFSFIMLAQSLLAALILAISM